MSKAKKKTKTIVAKNPEELAELLGLDRSVAIEWQIRHEVTKRIQKFSKIKKVSITNLAKRAGTTRAQFTRILKGDTGDISLDVLFRVLGALGQKVELKFQKVS